MLHPSIHERPIEAKMEKYTLNSLDFSFLCRLQCLVNLMCNKEEDGCTGYDKYRKEEGHINR
jgi:hypothetical protein